MRVGHAATLGDKPFETWAGLRLRSLRRRAAAWWLLEQDGTAVASLVAYPLRFREGSRRLEGFGLGSVATHPDHRKKGYASYLCDCVAQAAVADGRAIGLLYSAIPPALYERIGYRVSAAWLHRCEDPAGLAASGSQAELEPLDPRVLVETLARLYEAFHGGLHLERDERAMGQSLDYNPHDIFLGVGKPLQGYLRVRLTEPDDLDVVECIVPREMRGPVIRAAAALAAAQGMRTLSTWLPAGEGVDGQFEDLGRARTLPMLKGEVTLEGAHFYRSDYF